MTGTALVGILLCLSSCGGGVVRAHCGTNDVGVDLVELGKVNPNKWHLLAERAPTRDQVVCQFEYAPHLQHLVTPHAIWVTRSTSGRAIAWVKAAGQDGQIEVFQRDLPADMAESLRKVCGAAIAQARTCPFVSSMQYFTLGQPTSDGKLDAAVGSESPRMAGWDPNGSAVVMFDVMRWLRNYVVEPEVMRRFNNTGLDNALRRGRRLLHME